MEEATATGGGGRGFDGVGLCYRDVRIRAREVGVADIDLILGLRANFILGIATPFCSMPPRARSQYGKTEWWRVEEEE